jgi:hypothetical protein
MLVLRSVSRRASIWPGLFALLLAFLTLAAALPNVSRAAPGASTQCRLQKPLRFLERSQIVRKGRLDGKANQRALRYRVEHYGRVAGVELSTTNPELASTQIVATRFFGLPLSLHRRVVPALRCVERRIRKVCTSPKSRYTPQAVGGFRQLNTYRGGEVSNHLFGIAVDIDPERNPCCGCVEPWPTHRACQGDVKTIYERTELPRCWIQAFRRYGFFWLGDDPQLRDTMHFEYLGNPERVLAP